MKQKQAIFHVYRYQILPIAHQISLFDKPISSEELKAKKNELFLKALSSIELFSYTRTNLIHKLHISDELYFLKLAANRNINRSTREFVDEQIENWPKTFIIFNNNPNVQKVAIQYSTKVFANTNTIAEILEENLNRVLIPMGLHVYFEPLFEKKHFWEIVYTYPDRIIQAEFELISPNLANISHGLKVDLKNLSLSTNTQKTKLQLNSDKEASLTLSEADPVINSLVDYSSEGGGNISLRVKGLKKKIQTNNSVTSVEIDEIALEADAKDLSKFFEFLK